MTTTPIEMKKISFINLLRKIIMKKLSILTVSMMFAFNVQAGGLDTNKIFIGGGISNNDIGFGDDATGFQIFAGIPLPVKMGKARLSAEVGYMDSGEFEQALPFGFGTVKSEAKGVWVNAVVDVPVGKTISLVGRGGLDFGDDDGLMIGGGLGIAVGKKVDLRFEYVIRDHIDSLQANIVVGL